MIRRVVITGAPGAGKSTLLDALSKRGIAVEREVARAILEAPGGMELRDRRPQDFALAMLEAENIAYERAISNEGPTVFDRGFPDIAGFLRVEGMAVPASVDRLCREKRYAGPIFRAPPWREIYRQDQQRIQTWEEAVASDAAVCSAWSDYGYGLVDLPRTSPDDRVDFILGHYSL